MHISALYLACKAEAQEAIKTELLKLDWVDFQLEEKTKLIITIEAESEKDAERKVKELEDYPGVVAVQVAAFYNEET